jgi:hypothetical protein
MNNKNFFPWFVGFVDAEGNFQTTIVKRINKYKEITSLGLKYSFHLSLHLKDKPLLEFIQTKLENKGKIYTYNTEKRQEARLAITKVDDLKWLIENVFSKYPLITNHQATRYKKLEIGIINNIKNLKSLDAYSYLIKKEIPNTKNISEDYINNWIIGFLNGEVAFTKATKLNKNIPIIFLEHTDKESVSLIKNILKIGPNILTRTRDTRKTTYCLSISSKQDINNVVNFINKMDNLSGYKLIQYNKWKEDFNL